MSIEKSFSPNLPPNIPHIENRPKKERKENKMEKERRERIEKILKSHGLEAENKVGMLREIRDKGIRFFHVLAKTALGEKKFLKMLADTDSEESRRAIVREITVHRNIAAQLENNPDAGMKVRKFHDGETNIEKGESYAVVDAFPEDAQVGFIESEGTMEKLTPEHAYKCVEALLAMQKEIDADKLIKEIKREFHLRKMEDVFEIIDDIYDSYDGYRENTEVILSMREPELDDEMNEEEKAEEISRSLENHVHPEDIEKIEEWMREKYPDFYAGRYRELKKEREEIVDRGDNPEHGEAPLWMVMEYRLGARDFRQSVNELFARYENTVKSFQRKNKHFLVHGDCCPNNTFYGDAGEVELTDFGHAGVTKNELLALIHDFGNMRARAWNNRAYREALDEAIIEHYGSRGQEEAGKAVVALGILRSHMCLAGFFENYDIGKQREEQEKARRENTEADARKAFEISGIDL